MIISGGENVHPTQVEAVLTEHPGITDSAVVGVPDERWGERRGRLRGPRGRHARRRRVRAHCDGHPMLADFKRPRAYRFVDELPMTATGKKIHYQIRERAADDSANGRLETP